VSIYFFCLSLLNANILVHDRCSHFLCLSALSPTEQRARSKKKASTSRASVERRDDDDDDDDDKKDSNKETKSIRLEENGRSV
jgi:hypothetical protein